MYHSAKLPQILPDSAVFIALLGLFAALPALSIDICAPTLPLLAKSLHTSLTIAGLTVSLFMAGFAAGQWAGGYGSDHCGRKPVLLTGLACYTAAGLACMLATSGPELVAFRLLQGIGAGACAVVPFAMVQDLFTGEVARSKRSYVTVVFGAAPVLAPALGSLLSAAGGWRAVYVALSIAGAALLLITLGGLAETNRAGRPGAAAIPASPAIPLHQDAPFIGFVLTNALSYGALFAYITGAPIVIIGEMHRSSAVFSGVFACTALALTAGAWANGRLGRRHYTAAAVLGPSLAIAAVAAAALVVISVAGPMWDGALLLLPLLVVCFTRGTIAPNLQHVAIERRRDQAGTASAVLGVSQLASGALASAVVAILLPSFGARAVAVPMMLLAAAALAVWHWACRPPGKSQRVTGVLPI